MSKTFRRFIGTKEVEKFFSSNDGFNAVLKKIKFIKAGDGICVAELKVEKEHTNPLGGLHGGLSATLIDVVTSYALLTCKTCEMLPSISVDMHMTYHNPALLGDEIVINAQTIKAGKSLAFLECEIKKKTTDKVLVKGSHTKYIMC